MIDLYDIKKTYTAGAQPVEALKGVNLHIDDADIFGVIGYSGAGKSTLIRCVNLLERPDSGRVVVNGREMTTLSAEELRKARQKIGMIFQHFNLLKSGTVFENVALPLKNLRLPKQEIQEKVNHLLELVGLADKASVYPSQLSGGQKQRVAIARALANDPEVLLSDEATSALDPQTTYSILALLDDLNKKLGLTIVLITHEMQVIKEVCNKVAVLDNGVIVEQGDAIDVFSQPQHETTKKFIANLFQAGKIDVLLQNEEITAMLSDQGILVRLLFVGKSANRAYISEISRQFQINASIVFGNIDIVKSIPIGNLFVVFHGDSKKIWLAIQYLEQEGVGVEFIQRGEGLYEKGEIKLAKPFSSSHAESSGAV